MSDSNTPVERTVAWFETLDEVRAAELALEGQGVDAANISLQRVDPVGNRRDIDRRTLGWAGRRALIGGIVGPMLGAAVAVGIGAALGYRGGSLLIFAMVGAVFGFGPGFYYAVGSRLPVKPQTFDTFADDTPGDTWIAVSGPVEVRELAVSVLKDLQPTKIVEKV